MQNLGWTKTSSGTEVLMKTFVLKTCLNQVYAVQISFQRMIIWDNLGHVSEAAVLVLNLVNMITSEVNPSNQPEN